MSRAFPYMAEPLHVETQLEFTCVSGSDACLALALIFMDDFDSDD